MTKSYIFLVLFLYSSFVFSAEIVKKVESPVRNPANVTQSEIATKAGQILRSSEWNGYPRKLTGGFIILDAACKETEKFVAGNCENKTTNFPVGVQDGLVVSDVLVTNERPFITQRCFFDSAKLTPKVYRTSGDSEINLKSWVLCEEK